VRRDSPEGWASSETRFKIAVKEGLSVLERKEYVET
jgi:hypothetical protein